MVKQSSKGHFFKTVFQKKYSSVNPYIHTIPSPLYNPRHISSQSNPDRSLLAHQHPDNKLCSCTANRNSFIYTVVHTDPRTCCHIAPGELISKILLSGFLQLTRELSTVNTHTLSLSSFWGNHFSSDAGSKRFDPVAPFCSPQREPWAPRETDGEMGLQ